MADHSSVIAGKSSRSTIPSAITCVERSLLRPLRREFRKLRNTGKQRITNRRYAVPIESILSGACLASMKDMRKKLHAQPKERPWESYAILARPRALLRLRGQCVDNGPSSSKAAPLRMLCNGFGKRVRNISH